MVVEVNVNMMKVKIEYVKNEKLRDLRIITKRLAECNNSRIIKTRGCLFGGVGVVTVITRELGEVMEAVVDLNRITEYSTCVTGVKRMAKLYSILYNDFFNTNVKGTL